MSQALYMIHTVTGMSIPSGDSEVHHGVQGSVSLAISNSIMEVYKNAGLSALYIIL